MVDRLVNHPTNTITMVAPFAATAAWLWQISQPYPRDPLRKGWGEGDMQGFYLIRLTGQEKN
jgi:hypothetical protein